MLEIGKKKLEKEFFVFTVPMGAVARIFPNEIPLFAVTSNLYGWRGNAYYVGSQVVLYCGYEIIGDTLSEQEIEKLAAYYDTMSTPEAKDAVRKRLTDILFGWDD